MSTISFTNHCRVNFAVVWLGMRDPLVQFGDFVPGEVYVDRPGAYGIALGMRATILVVAVGDLLALPGGGLEKAETFEKGLVREFQEETGYLVRILKPLGCAGQYVYAQAERMHFNKLCQFFEVELIGERGITMESDHQVRWISIEQAAASLTEEAHRWAVARAVNG